MKKGFVYLTGAGPGDPELVSLKAMRVLGEADCIIYDYLANASLLDQFSCEKIYAGKQGSSHTLSQDQINALIIEKAGEGKTVVRLKGGDPFIFGRGGEEAEDLVAAGIPFEIIPGISSFYSAPAYAGIPVTHRDFSNAIEVITGHRRAESADKEDVNFPEYDPFRTFVFLMGMANLPHISKVLVEEKHFPADTPVGIISWGTRPEQQTVTGTLTDIGDVVKKSGIKPPAIIVVGRVVSLREKLRWFDSKPLFGKTVVVTRSRKQSSIMSAKLTQQGAHVIEFPVIEIEPAADMKPLEAAIKNLASYKWLVFTSQNAVNIFFERLNAVNLDARSLAGLKIAAIGRVTGEELKHYGLKPDLVPEKFVAENLAETMLPMISAGDRILLPCSADARPVLAESLRKTGAQVDRIHIYRTVKPERPSPEILDAVRNADCVTFASSSTAVNFFEIVSDIRGICASIGPVTSEALRKTGHEPAVEASVYTIDGLLETINGFFSRTK